MRNLRIFHNTFMKQLKPPDNFGEIFHKKYLNSFLHYMRNLRLFYTFMPEAVKTA